MGRYYARTTQFNDFICILAERAIYFVEVSDKLRASELLYGFCLLTPQTFLNYSGAVLV